MSLNLVKVADAVDALADHLDYIEHEKLSSVKAARQATIDTLAGKYAEATGEEIPDTIRSKLAESDKDVVALVQSIVEKQAGRLETLGGPATKDDGSAPRSVKEAADDAEERFKTWILEG